MLVSISIFCGFILFFTGVKLFQKKEIYFVKFTDKSVSGLNIGSKVEYNGVNIGVIDDIFIDSKSIENIIVKKIVVYGESPSIKLLPRKQPLLYGSHSYSSRKEILQKISYSSTLSIWKRKAEQKQIGNGINVAIFRKRRRENFGKRLEGVERRIKYY